MNPQDISDLKVLEGRLFALRNRGSKYSLDRMQALCAAWGNPQDEYPAIHVAGTNGKGSVCAMFESVLRAHSFLCGLYTSPHIVYLGERLRLGGKNIPVRELLALMEEVSASADEIFSDKGDDEKPSFFEHMTLAAFAYFARKNADFAVIETGLGGRLDATNVLKTPRLCVITSISLDHTDMLGNSIAEIAREKAGIIKQGVSVVCGFMPDEAKRVIKEVAASKNSKAYFLDETNADISSMPHTNLECGYQRRNAALVMLALRVMKAENPSFKFDESIALSALMRVDWRARWQKIPLKENGTFMILDASHNEEGARELEKNLAALSKENAEKKIVVALGSLEKTRARALLRAASAHAGRLILMRPDNPRSLSQNDLSALLDYPHPPYEACEVAELFPRKNFCAKIAEDEILVCTGSIYLAGEILGALEGGMADRLQDIL